MALEKHDEVFWLEGEELYSLPVRPMKEGIFGKTLEDALQTLIEKHPNVIPGQMIDPESDDPPRFILLRREMPISSWSLDHLLVDQRGVLTLVETKLIQNPEARREVIGQIMEYAANAVERWNISKLQEDATKYWFDRGKELSDVIKEGFGVDIIAQELWDSVEENLKHGKIRLIIAADKLSPEVRRIIEYLNVEMTNAEVYGLELKCYGDPAKLVLVPRLIGQTQLTADRKQDQTWNIEKLRLAYEQLPDRALGKRLTEVMEWANSKGLFLGTVAKDPAFGLRGSMGSRVMSFYRNGTIYCYLAESCFTRGVEERDELTSWLKDLNLLDPDFDAEQVTSGRNLIRRIDQLSKEDLERLLEIMYRICCISQ